MSTTKIPNELKALRQYKKTVDIGFTAAIISMQHEFGGRRISYEEALVLIQAEFRRAEEEFQKTTRGSR